MKHQYKVGDKVKIKSDLNDSDHGDGCGVVTDMIEFRGETATIIDVCNQGAFYCLDIDKLEWIWDSNMFDEVVEEKIFDFAKFKNGYIVVNCKTTEELNDFATKLTSIYQCRSIEKITGWFTVYGSDTCIRWDDNPDVVYDRKEYYIKKGNTIVNWSDYMTSIEETPVFVKEDFFVELTLDEVIALATEKIGKAVKIKK